MKWNKTCWLLGHKLETQLLSNYAYTERVYCKRCHLEAYRDARTKKIRAGLKRSG